MKIHHLRNATMIIEVGNYVILVDPMLGNKGESGPTFTFIRFKPQRNPIVSLPDNAAVLLGKVTHCLITHLHPDHIDQAGVEFLRANQTPVICSVRDEKKLKGRGVNISQTVNYWEETDFPGGRIQGIPAVHGYGFVAKLMGDVMGFFLSFPNEKSIYLSSDTVYTEAVHKVLTELKPDISVVACGTAQLDLFQPLLMRPEDILKFARNAPGKVIANHMEAVNHCPTTRLQLSELLSRSNLRSKVYIPNDGEGKVY
ncbi:L-ascorbate metabolism protein UlaG (beta-lactamase superfamily) [Algoriphagus sp. 4150]|uniref:MBL fold metallo-hydrolase n=1 Tax=Algoriphagus sp. 4150 TaxID=2817756 RepID=UPI002862D1D4|nr:MBL fold metallo-hydrolase [Algoriphagus sp. 4150]MDR7128117.1 L-ascorbate metabolism protein UlaG (beta-lactamase superfamily) [Algoriphagus sp. 4150]